MKTLVHNFSWPRLFYRYSSKLIFKALKKGFGFYMVTFYYNKFNLLQCYHSFLCKQFSEYSKEHFLKLEAVVLHFL